MLILRWFLDGTRLAQLACDNRISVLTAYRYLHEGLTVLADQPRTCPPHWSAAEAGFTHLNLDGTVIRTDRVAAPVPNKADLWWSGKHKHHGGTSRSLPHPTAGRSGSRRSRPGREHDTTRARTHGLIAALNRLAGTLDIPLTDLGYQNAGAGLRHPVKKPKGGELTDDAKAFNSVIRGVHGVAERANVLLKVTLKALRRVSLDPKAITRITRAALVLLQMERGRTS
ncbi:transposase family protein [Streptomyces sp. NBC_00154]|uniref:transposase family protein n=1 Tax=Streptomyces sp. NBC_00154 TaxID=2975670 RepID=UPI002257C48F|nr:transposase family protein [Streptomyces sp. NBC_00154]MCX5317231.1 transposase family protein [Streptomyces sp. NBC_00154]